MTTGTVSAIHIHPIKSCRRIELDSVRVTATGIEGDRQWQVSSGKRPVTQRQKSVLATVRPTPIEGGLRIEAPGVATIEVPQPDANDAVTGSLTGVTVDVGDAGDVAAAWFSELLDDEVRLYGRTEDSVLDLPSALDVFGQPIAFGDAAPVLVANTASLDWLVDNASEPFGMERFRPNFVVDTDEPFAEDTWARFSLGAAQLRHGLAWPRCAVPQVDQDSGERRGEPAKVMRKHRWCTDAPNIPEAWQPIVTGSALFGVGCAVGPIGTMVNVGDRLQVDERCAPLIEPPA